MRIRLHSASLSKQFIIKILSRFWILFNYVKCSGLKLWAEDLVSSPWYCDVAPRHLQLYIQSMDEESPIGGILDIWLDLIEGYRVISMWNAETILDRN